MRFDRRRLVPLLVLFALLSPPSLHAAGPGDTGNAFIVLRAEGAHELWSFVDEWNADGARLPHVYPPDVVIGDVPASLEKAMLADPRVAEIHRKPARLSGYGKAADNRARIARSWNAESVPGDLSAAPDPIPFGDALLPHPNVNPSFAPKRNDGPTTYGRAYGADFFQTSEIFLGRIAVGVILPNCPSAAYSTDDEDNVLAAVRGCMDYWATAVGYIGVEFVYDIHKGVPCSRVFTNSDPRVNEEEWMHEIMNSLGYTWSPNGEAWEPVYEYIDSLRTRLETEWGICLFIPNTPSFAGSIAYARQGGPYLVSPAGTQQEGNRLVAGIVWLSHLLIHETAHLFWALDEYAPGSPYGSPARCGMRSGYLNTYNRNSLYVDHTCVGAAHFPCCMETPAANVCDYTLGAMGLWNSDDDNVPDIADTDPSITVEPIADTVTVIDPEITGIAAEIPLHNHIQRDGVRSSDITFNKIEHVVYRIDQMVDGHGLPLWLSADPEGGFDDVPTQTAFSFRPDSLYAGPHHITIRATNTVGNRTGTTYPDATIDVYVKAIALHDFAAEPDYDGRVRLSYRIRGGAFGAEAAVYRSYEGGGEEVFATFPLEDESTKEFYDDGAIPGKAYAYRLEARALGETWSYTTDIVSPAPIHEGAYLSMTTPNPFRSETVISYRVPRGWPLDQSAIDGKPEDDDGSITPPDVEEGAPRFADGAPVQYDITRIEIAIFNVAGRLVKSYPNVHSYEGFYPEPLTWDGTDNSGREVPQGVYFVRMKAGPITESRKLVLLK